jgi:MYXO-CTERM domain-containing protein
MASDARWALNVQNASTDTIATNNVFFNRVTNHGAIDISADSFPITSDYNVVKDLFSNDGNFVSLAAWRTATNQDAHSVIATEAAVFQNPAADDYQVLSGGPAIDIGTSVNAPSSDLLGYARPVGKGFDVGAYEFDASAGGSGSGGAAAGGAGNAGASGNGGASSGGAGASAGGVPSSNGGAASSSGGTGAAGAGGNSAAGTPGAGGAAGSSSASSDAGPSSGGGDNASGSKDSGGCGCRSAGTDARTRGNGVVALAALFAAIAIGRKKRR